MPHVDFSDYHVKLATGVCSTRRLVTWFIDYAECIRASQIVNDEMTVRIYGDSAAVRVLCSAEAARQP
jgi:hypothetical protein